MIDAHCHLQNTVFEDELEEVLAEAKNRGIEKFAVNGTSEKDWEKVALLARKQPAIVPHFGLHPWYLGDRSSQWLETLESFLDEFPEAGVGEIGLDRWVKHHDIAAQIPVFENQWQLAVEKGRTITVHCLRAWGHLDQCLRDLPESAFLLHSYSGSREMVPVFADHGAYFSISGYFLRPDKSEKLAVFDRVPPDRLLLETDAPEMNLPKELDLFPDSEFNHPANLSVVYREIAARREMEFVKLESLINANFQAWCRESL